jgi:hypothetical protein
MDNGEVIEVVEVPEFKTTDETIVMFINGRAVQNNSIQLTIDAIKSLKLTLSKGKVSRFKLKIPGVKTDVINGNTISKISIGNLNKVSDGDVITIFDIKDDNNTKLPPVIITVLSNTKTKKTIIFKEGIPKTDVPKTMAKAKNEDYMRRYLLLKASKNQTKPLTYKLNGKKSTFNALESYIEQHPKANVDFIKGNINTLHFYNNSSTAMSNEDLQTVYSQLFEFYDKGNSKEPTIFYKKVD